MPSIKRPFHEPAADRPLTKKVRKEPPTNGPARIVAARSTDNARQAETQSIKLPSYKELLSSLDLPADAIRHTRPNTGALAPQNPRDVSEHRFGINSQKSASQNVAVPRKARFLSIDPDAPVQSIEHDSTVPTPPSKTRNKDKVRASVSARSGETAAPKIRLRKVLNTVTLLIANGHRLINSAGRFVPDGSKDAERFASHLMRVSVDQTGQTVHRDQPGAMPWFKFTRSIIFDPATFKRVAAGTKGAVNPFEYVRSMAVDPKSRGLVNAAHPGSIKFRSWINRQFVDSAGKSVATETPGAIPLSTFIQNLPVNLRSGNLEAVATSSTVPLGEFISLSTPRIADAHMYVFDVLGADRPKVDSNFQLVDPQTGVTATSGTIGAIPRRLAKNLRLVDPNTGMDVPHGTPGAVAYAKVRDAQPVDPVYGYLVAHGTPGAVPFGHFKNLQPVDPKFGIPVPPDWEGAIPSALFDIRQ